MRVLKPKGAEFKELVSSIDLRLLGRTLAVSLLFPLLLAPNSAWRVQPYYLAFSRRRCLSDRARFKTELPRYRAIPACADCLVHLAITFAFTAGPISFKAEQSYFWRSRRLSKPPPYRRLVVTRWKGDTRLYINGNLQFSSRDRGRYHEALVLPALVVPNAERVLILGGGDGSAAREKYPQVRNVALVDLIGMHTTFKAPQTSGSIRARCPPQNARRQRQCAKWLEGSCLRRFDVMRHRPAYDPPKFTAEQTPPIPMLPRRPIASPGPQG